MKVFMSDVMGVIDKIIFLIDDIVRLQIFN